MSLAFSINPWLVLILTRSQSRPSYSYWRNEEKHSNYLSCKLLLTTPKLHFLPPSNLSQPHFGHVWGWSPTLGKVWSLKSSGTPECLELDSKAQNTSHCGVLGVIGKVLKRKYRKWPRIGHSDICSPSYGQKKGRESNWQFDSRPLKVGNRPLFDVTLKSATRRWKALDESYNFGSRLVPIRIWGEELWPSKVPRLQPGTVSGLPLGSLGKKGHLDVASAVRRKEYYKGGRWWLPPSPGCGESCVSKCPW